MAGDWADEPQADEFDGYDDALDQREHDREALGLRPPVSRDSHGTATAWKRLDAEPYPRDRMFMVRSRVIPIGCANPADQRTYAFAHGGTGRVPGLWALNDFWTDGQGGDPNSLTSALWDEWAEVPA